MATHLLLISEARTATVQILERIAGHLERSTGLAVTSRLLEEVEPDDLDPGTYPIIIRSCHPLAVRLAAAFRRSGVRYGFYLDDNFWLLDPATELGRHYAARPTRRRLDAMVRGADPVIAATPLLRDWLAPRARAVVQLDSFFDFSLVPETLPPRAERPGLRVGFAASMHRGDDLAAVSAAVLGALEEHGDLEVEIIGAEGGTLAEHPRTTTFPHLDSYEKYLAFQRERAWDIGIAPLGSAASNAFKTDNKYREYAALGIAGIYQDAPPYAAVRDGETGLLAGSVHSWDEALRLYCTQRDLIDRVRSAAWDDAHARLSLEAVGPQWQAFIAAAPGAGSRPGALDAVRRRIAPPSGPWSRRMLRLRLLTAYGRSHLAERGVLSTVQRTVRFLLRGGAPGGGDDVR